MPDSTFNTAIYLLPGMSAEIRAHRSFVGHGVRTVSDSSGKETSVELVNGFGVLYPDIGTIAAVPQVPAVIYTHKKYGLNKIIYFSINGEMSYVDIISVPIHDHSSIVTGGPAYGTYFTDDETT
jgi:hypothetical protein